ncbi:nucleoside hydrolase [Thalassomonas viridans]|uniref:Nucleoside hydrolase n=1 Tax=Thalassomonas viridans TaxID=137584 RepID=A0AAF0C9J4_9GAMM|nr:nucleoside hydrolase [Thalassomonas viridans]WDE07572.1 nucleoside hydrolase [Thalassomonas viridans]
MTRKIIIDTDPGIDDAMAIMLAFNAPSLDVLGLTTTFGNVPVSLATSNALKLVELAQKNVPVAEGVATPLSAPQLPHPDFVHGKDGFGNIDWPAETTKADGRSAARFIVDTVRANPNEVTLIALGPLGNLAKALELDPEIVNLVDEVILMGGAAVEPGNVTPVAEANIINDPHAADIVFTADWPVTMVGLDVTHKVMMDEALLQKIRAADTKAGELLYQSTQFYFDFYNKTFGINGCFVHDASTIVYAMAPEVFTTEPGIVRVATEGVAIGQTIIAHPDKHYPLPHWQDKPQSKICMGVDSERLLAIIEATFTDAA